MSEARLIRRVAAFGVGSAALLALVGCGSTVRPTAISGPIRRVTIEVLGRSTVINYIRWGAAIRVPTPAAADLVPAPAGY